MSSGGGESSRELIASALTSPLVLGQCLSAAQIYQLRRQVAAIPEASWGDGDDSDHSWRECPLPQTLHRTIGEVISLIRSLDGLSSRTAGWINCFETGGWIAAHRDASGDVQAIIPLELPNPEAGGELWIGTQSQTVPMAVGDLLLFNAAAVPHGTLPVAGFSRRLTINLRFWLAVAIPDEAESSVNPTP